jgi:BetI-type transcriptional repressor, C-terminal
LEQEMMRLSSERARLRLFFEFWAAGLSDTGIRQRMQRELERYRMAFRPITEAVLVAEPDRFAHTTPDGLAAVAVSVIMGCAVQSMIEPHLDVREFLAAAEALLRRPTSASALA